MPLLQQLLSRLTGSVRDAAAALPAQPDHRLARVSRKCSIEPPRPPVEVVLNALEEECAEPLYDRSVYVSPAQGSAGA